MRLLRSRALVWRSVLSEWSTMAMRCADVGSGGSKDGKRGKPVDGAEPGALAAKPAQQELHDEKTREYERKTGTESRDERGEKQHPVAGVHGRERLRQDGAEGNRRRSRLRKRPAFCAAFT